MSLECKLCNHGNNLWIHYFASTVIFTPLADKIDLAVSGSSGIEKVTGVLARVAACLGVDGGWGVTLAPPAEAGLAITLASATVSIASLLPSSCLFDSLFLSRVGGFGWSADLDDFGTFLDSEIIFVLVLFHHSAIVCGSTKH